MMGDGRKNEWTQKEIDDQLTAAYGAAKADIATEFKQAFPRKKVQDVLYFASGSRPTVKNLLNRKLEKTKVPVYNYLFAWEYPINGGITSFHCAELAFCFHALSVPQIKTATGGGAVALALQDKVSQAWINFAKTGIRTSRGSSGSPTRRTTRRRWCSTPSVGRAPRRQAGVAAAGTGRTRCADRSRQRAGWSLAISSLRLTTGRALLRARPFLFRPLKPRGRDAARAIYLAKRPMAASGAIRAARRAGT